jgi:hypothetical protein
MNSVAQCIVIEHRCLEIIFSQDGDINVVITNEKGEHANIIIRSPAHTDRDTPKIRKALYDLYKAIEEESVDNQNDVH